MHAFMKVIFATLLLKSYDIQELKSFCSNFHLENLTIDNFSDSVVIADKYDDSKLCFAAQHYFFQNSSEIVNIPENKCLLIRLNIEVMSQNSYYLLNF